MNFNNFIYKSISICFHLRKVTYTNWGHKKNWGGRKKKKQNGKGHSNGK